MFLRKIHSVNLLLSIKAAFWGLGGFFLIKQIGMGLFYFTGIGKFIQFDSLTKITPIKKEFANF